MISGDWADLLAFGGSRFVCASFHGNFRIELMLVPGDESLSFLFLHPKPPDRRSACRDIQTKQAKQELLPVVVVVVE